VEHGDGDSPAQRRKLFHVEQLQLPDAVPRETDTVTCLRDDVDAG
jgi:hypothetical protein